MVSIRRFTSPGNCPAKVGCWLRGSEHRSKEIASRIRVAIMYGTTGGTRPCSVSKTEASVTMAAGWISAEPGRRKPSICSPKVGSVPARLVLQLAYKLGPTCVGDRPRQAAVLAHVLDAQGFHSDGRLGSRQLGGGLVQEVATAPGHPQVQFAQLCPDLGAVLGHWLGSRKRLVQPPQCSLSCYQRTGCMQRGDVAVIVRDGRKGFEAEIDTDRRRVSSNCMTQIDVMPINLDLQRYPPSPRSFLHGGAQHSRPVCRDAFGEPCHVLPRRNGADSRQPHRTSVTRLCPVAVISESTAVFSLTPRWETQPGTSSLTRPGIEKVCQCRCPRSTCFLGDARRQSILSEPRKLRRMSCPPGRFEGGGRPRHRRPIFHPDAVRFFGLALVECCKHARQGEVFHHARQPSVLSQGGELFVVRRQFHSVALHMPYMQGGGHRKLARGRIDHGSIVEHVFDCWQDLDRVKVCQTLTAHRQTRLTKNRNYR
jgi:hypothetical protein